MPSNNNVPTLGWGVGMDVTIVTIHGGVWHKSETERLARTVFVYANKHEHFNVVVVVGYWDLQSIEEKLGEEKDGLDFGHLRIKERTDKRLPFDLLEEFQVGSLQRDFVFA